MNTAGCSAQIPVERGGPGLGGADDDEGGKRHGLQINRQCAHPWPLRFSIHVKPSVLYVLGYGRSGSTMLGMALGQHPGMVNLGEISVLPTFVPGPTYIAPRACGCLRTLDECPYWQGVARRLGRWTSWRTTAPASRPPWGGVGTRPGCPSPAATCPLGGGRRPSMAAAIVEAGATGSGGHFEGGLPRLVALALRCGGAPFIWLTRRLEDVIRSQIRHGNSAVKTGLSWRLAQRQAAKWHARGAGRARGTPDQLRGSGPGSPRGLGEMLTHVACPGTKPS